MSLDRYLPYLLATMSFLLAGSLHAAQSSAPPAKPTEENPPLMSIGWELAKAVSKDWSHKDNAALSVVEDGGRKALRLSSKFAPYSFTWTTRSFAPHSAAGVVHLGFRIRGDASGHRLQVSLGTRRPDNHLRTLYYTNTAQSVDLNFRGWREVTVELERFATPGGGLREPDLENIIFLQFMVTANDAKRPLDLAIADIRFFGHTPAELAELDRRRAEREKIIQETGAALGAVRQELAQLHAQMDEQAKRGRYVDLANVYLAALDWMAGDAKRCLEAEELEIVRQGPAFLSELKKELASREKIFQRIGDRAATEPDPYHAAENPYFKSVLDVARTQTRRETTYAKGRRGYRATPNAWTFSSYGNLLFDMAWTMTTPRSPLRHHPLLLANALNLIDTIAHQHTDGDFNIDRTAIYGRDPNINRFCLAPALDAWWHLRQAYPGLLPAGRQAELEAGLKRLADYQVTDYGLERLAKSPHEKFPAYPNMDVHHILIMEFAHRLWGEPQYAKERDAFIKILASAVYPGGGFAYINTQNECFVYHQLNVAFSARYWKLTGHSATLEMLRRTIPYYPYNVEPAGMPESYTDACWKHYWTAGSPAGPDVIAGLFDDAQNKQVANVCGVLAGYGHGYTTAIAAEFWKPIAPKPLPDGYVIHDTNIEGPHGRYGTWSFAGNGRNYGLGYQGKDTFVGAMIADPTRKPLPLDSALQIVTSEVRLNHTDNHWVGGRCASARERLTTALGPDFGSLAVRYTVSRPNWHHKEDDLIPWDGTQVWYLSKTRLVGLVALEATADETRAAVHGRIRLGMSRDLKPIGPQAWSYGRMRVKVHAHNYAQIDSLPSETFYLDKPDKYRSTEITLLDPLSVRAGQKGNVRFPKGSRYWFLVEVFADDAGEAAEVKPIEDRGLAGFWLREKDRQVAVLHNVFNQALKAGPALPPKFAPATRYDDHDGKGKPLATGTPIEVPASKHVVLVAPANR